MPDDNTVPQKRCTKCKQEFPATAEYFGITTRDGMRSICKMCHLEQNRQHRKNNPDKEKERHHHYYEANTDECKARSRRYYQSNPDKAKTRARHYREANLDKVKSRHQRYSKANPDKSREQTHRRRAKKRGLPNTLTDQEWRNALAYFNGCCAYCDRSPSLFDYYKVLQHDHFVPLSKGGPYTAQNIIPGCQTCNDAKHDYDALEWLISKWGKTIGKRKYNAIMIYFKSLHSSRGSGVIIMK